MHLTDDIGLLRPSRAWKCYRVRPLLPVDFNVSKARGTPKVQTQRMGYPFRPVISESFVFASLYCHSAKSAEPPPPYSPPQQFVPLTAETIKNHMCLLHRYLKHSLTGFDTLDDPQNSAETKLGRLGQAARSSRSSSYL